MRLKSLLALASIVSAFLTTDLSIADTAADSSGQVVLPGWLTNDNANDWNPVESLELDQQKTAILYQYCQFDPERPVYIPRKS